MLLPATTRGFLPLRASHTIKSMSRMTTIGLQALLSADSSASAQIQSATRGFGSPISSRLKVKAYVTSSAATRPFSAVNPSAAAPVMAHPRGYSTEATDSQQSPCGQSSEAAPKPPVQIVSNLLCMPDPDAKESWDGKGFKGLKVALFQRSESVSVYRYVMRHLLSLRLSNSCAPSCLIIRLLHWPGVLLQLHGFPVDESTISVHPTDHKSCLIHCLFVIPYPDSISVIFLFFSVSLLAILSCSRPITSPT
jgi:hypothetical protein